MIIDIGIDILTGMLTNRLEDGIAVKMKDKIEDCYNKAAKSFYNKYGDQYGDSLSSFLVRQENIDLVEKSFNYSDKLLSYEDFNPTSFDGFDSASQNAIIDFINIFKKEVFKDFDLSKILIEKEHIQESKSAISNIQNIKDNMITKSNYEEMMGYIKKLAYSMIDSSEGANGEIHKNEVVSSKIKDALEKKGINISEKEITTIINTEGKITAELIVKYNDFLGSFKNGREIFNYAYYNQQIIELNPISFTLKLENEVIREIVCDKNYKGKVVKINFTNYGDIKFMIENSKKVCNKKDEISIVKIYPPRKLESIIKVNIDNEDYETILTNINLKLIEQINIEEEHFCVIFSNKDQNDSNVFIEFYMEIKYGQVLKTDIKIRPMNNKSAIDNLRWLKVIKSINNCNEVIATNCSNGIMLFKGKINFDNTIESIDEKIVFIKKILFIQDKTGKLLDIPEVILDEDFESVEELDNILKYGKVSMENLIIEGTSTGEFNGTNIDENEIYNFTFKSYEKYNLFNTEFDLGEQITLLEKVKIKNIKENMFYYKTEEDSKNIRIYKKYYGDYSIEEMMEREGI